MRHSSRSTNLPIYRILTFFLLLVSTFLPLGPRLRTGGGAGIAHAENIGPGGGTRIIVGDEIVGPYRLYITISPEPAYVGALTIVVRVSDPETDLKVLDADISVELTHSEDGERLTGQATHKDAGNPIDYAAHIPVERTGSYSGMIRISGPAGGAEVTFLQQVAPKRGLTGILVAGFPFLVLLALLGGIWYARAGSRPAPTG